jgi:hypothetical protein
MGCGYTGQVARLVSTGRSRVSLRSKGGLKAWVSPQVHGPKVTGAPRRGHESTAVCHPTAFVLGVRARTRCRLGRFCSGNPGMACIVFISIADRNAQGQRLMSASLRQRGHECHIIFLKPYCTGRQAVRDREPLSWAGIDNRARAFSYAEPSLPSEREFGLLRRVLEEARPLGQRSRCAPLARQRAQ